MRSTACLVLALGLAAAPNLVADTLNVSADAQTSSIQPRTRFGGLPLMTVRGTSGAVLNGYARFDLSPLPEGAAVDKAVLRLWVNLVTTPGTIEVVTVLEPWEEDTITDQARPETGGDRKSVV